VIKASCSWLLPDVLLMLQLQSAFMIFTTVVLDGVLLAVVKSGAKAMTTGLGVLLW
jgi:hypothetical protein